MRRCAGSSSIQPPSSSFNGRPGKTLFAAPWVGGSRPSSQKTQRTADWDSNRQSHYDSAYVYIGVPTVQAALSSQSISFCSNLILDQVS